MGASFCGMAWSRLCCDRQPANGDEPAPKETTTMRSGQRLLRLISVGRSAPGTATSHSPCSKHRLSSSMMALITWDRHQPPDMPQPTP